MKVSHSIKTFILLVSLKNILKVYQRKSQETNIILNFGKKILAVLKEEKNIAAVKLFQGETFPCNYLYVIMLK